MHDHVRGHRPIERRINVRNELAKYRRDPLFPFIYLLEGYHSIKVLEDQVSMYQLAYSWYFLSLERFLPEMSLAIRWSKGPYWALKEGRKFTAAERKLAGRYSSVARYLYLDYYNCLIYARILLDRVAGLSRLFLLRGNRPSFTSFADHKKFFKKQTSPYGEHEAYATYIRQNTDWFETPLKEVRDKFIVHASPRHMRNSGYPQGDSELSLVIILPDDPKGAKPLSNVRAIFVSIPKLAQDMHGFLTWFNEYAVARTKAKSGAGAPGENA